MVVGVTESATSLLALRRAAAEAAQRSSPLHVIAGGPLHATLVSLTEDDRELHTVDWILRMPQVTVSIVDQTTPEALVSYCREVAASLLVIGLDESATESDLESPATTHRLLDDAGCDVLVIHTRQGIGSGV